MRFPRPCAWFLLLLLTLLGSTPCWAQAPARGAAERLAAMAAPRSTQGLRLPTPLPGSLLDPLASADAEALSRARDCAEMALQQAGTSLAGWLAAGAGVPPGLPAERASERRAQQSAALAELGLAFEAAGSARRRAAIEACWAAGELDPRIASATLRLVGSLGDVEFAPRLVAELARAPESRRGAAARRGLQELYGLWFASAEEARRFVEPKPLPAVGPYKDALKDLLAERMALFQRLWDADPASAALAFEQASPRLRSEAARRLAQWSASGASGQEGGPRLQALERLITAWSREGDEAVLGAQIEAAAALWTGLQLDEGQRRELSESLAKASAAAPQGLLHVLARAWLSLPSAGPEAALGLHIEGLLERLRSWEHPDPDVCVALIESLRQWARSHSSGAGAELALRLSTDSLFALLDQPRIDPSVRLAAAAAMRDLAGQRDLPALLGLLERAPDEPGLRFALVAVLERVAGGGELPAEQAEPLERAVARLLDDPDAGVRRRALALLDGPALARRTSAALLELLLGLLEREPEAEQRAALVALIAARDWPAAPTLLLRPSVLALVAEEARRNEVRTLDLVCSALARQVGPDPQARLAAARQLMDLAPEPARARCAARAFALAAPGEAGALERLAIELGDPGEAHLRELLEWAGELAELHFGQRLLLERGAAQRLLEEAYELLLPRALERGVLSGQETRWFAARLAPAIERLPVPVVRAAIEAAQAESSGSQGAALELRAARFLDARGESAAALQSYARLLASEAGLEPGAEQPLALEDWRAVLRLSLSVQGSASEAEQAIALGQRAARALLEWPGWPLGEPDRAWVELEWVVAALEDASDGEGAARLLGRLAPLLTGVDGPTLPVFLLEPADGRERLERLNLRLSGLVQRLQGSVGGGPSGGAPEGAPDRAPVDDPPAAEPPGDPATPPRGW
jgi:hypothetical protein